MIYFSEGGGEFKRTRAEMFHPPLAKIPPPHDFFTGNLVNYDKTMTSLGVKGGKCV